VPLRVGLVGDGGAVALVHIGTVEAIENVQIVAMCDAQAETAEMAVRRLPECPSLRSPARSYAPIGPAAAKRLAGPGTPALPRTARSSTRSPSGDRSRSTSDYADGARTLDLTPAVMRSIGSGEAVRL